MSRSPSPPPPKRRKISRELDGRESRVSTRHRPGSRSGSPTPPAPGEDTLRRERESKPSKKHVNAALRSPSPYGREQDKRSPKRSRSRSPVRGKKGRRKHQRSRSRSPSRGHDERRRDREARDGQARKSPKDAVGGTYRHADGGKVTYGRAPRERSMSPFSKRMALTQALNRR